MQALLTFRTHPGTHKWWVTYTTLLRGLPEPAAATARPAWAQLTPVG